MRDVIEKLEEAFEKVLCEFLGDCYVCYVKRDGKWYLVGLLEGSVPYAKVVPYDEAPPFQNCEGLLAFPKGLFAFADDPEELVERILKKTERLS